MENSVKLTIDTIKQGDSFFMVVGSKIIACEYLCLYPMKSMNSSHIIININKKIGIVIYNLYICFIKFLYYEQDDNLEGTI